MKIGQKVNYKHAIDVSDDDRHTVEYAANSSLDTLDIHDVNNFLNELYLFHMEADEPLWRINSVKNS